MALGKKIQYTRQTCEKNNFFREFPHPQKFQIWSRLVICPILMYALKNIDHVSEMKANFPLPKKN